jgi:hypothetical protein
MQCMVADAPILEANTVPRLTCLRFLLKVRAVDSLLWNVVAPDVAMSAGARACRNPSFRAFV